MSLPFFGSIPSFGLQARCVLVAFAVHSRGKKGPSASVVSPGLTGPGHHVFASLYGANGKQHPSKRSLLNPSDSFKQFQIKAAGGVLFRHLTGTAYIPVVSPPTVVVHLAGVVARPPTVAIPSAAAVFPTPVVLLMAKLLKRVFLLGHETPNSATWFGGSCFFVEFQNGLRVLFNPVFEESPMKIRLQRYLRVEDIPYIDVVMTCHNHHDHPSCPIVQKLAEKHPDCHFFVPLGNKSWFRSCGIRNVTEMDWMEQCDVSLPCSPSKGPIEVHELGSIYKLGNISARITCLPCRGDSCGCDCDNCERCEVLRASWFIEAGGKNVYFVGDTSYQSTFSPSHEGECLGGCPDWCHRPKDNRFDFKNVGKLYGPFDLGLIPIDAYKPLIFEILSIDPYDAVEIFKDTQCKRALAMHWGTWLLEEDDAFEPPVKFREALKANNLPETGVFDICRIGERKEF
ncbi:hypothetical protein PHISCL_06895 [Aspergillus sclerotialis]|uniref:Metallo-beta-lactamase domain-containing protein n=1 Tax=Aspergillus sclerotialis TaxID=2070753 RepID=A0A3A2ZCV9_9EURO|nr:hypothetical protein PHISCL_06895 [Aspergillus sclerotialis]